MASRALSRDPAQLRFHYGPAGKPTLTRDGGGDDVRFNVSHTGGLALYSISRGWETGIDVERIQPHLAKDSIAQRFFSPWERSVLRALPERARIEAFFSCWTRKEAYVKARGAGLAIPLDSFDVTLAPGEPAALLNTRPDPADAARWTLRALAPAPGYVGAVAMERRDGRIRQWQWSA